MSSSLHNPNIGQPQYNPWNMHMGFTLSFIILLVLIGYTWCVFHVLQNCCTWILVFVRWQFQTTTKHDDAQHHNAMNRVHSLEILCVYSDTVFLTSKLMPPQMVSKIPNANKAHDTQTTVFRANLFEAGAVWHVGVSLCATFDSNPGLQLTYWLH